MKRLLLTLTLAVAANAQETTATLFGTVHDPAGALVAGARVSARNQATGLERTVTAGSDGSWVIPLLPPGSYSVAVSRSGFKKYERRDITLAVNQNARVDAILELGDVSQTVSVSADSSLVELRTSSLGSVVDSNRIVELPLNGRNPIELARLVPGVGPGVIPDKTIINPPLGMRVSVNGGRPGLSSFLLDGANHNDSIFGGGYAYPSPDSLQEFRVLTGSYSAEFGKSSGGIFNAITKSGTNELHGSLFEFFRNDKLNARNFFSPTVPTLRQNQFGGVLGGKIIRDRLFYFGSYQGYRIREAALAASAFPPTALERQGDFTGSRRAPLRDPLTGQPFPGNRIPANRLDPITRNILDKFVPLPNTADGRYVELAPYPTTEDQVLVKTDWDTSRGRLSVRHLLNFARETNPLAAAGANIPGYAPAQIRDKTNTTGITHTYTLGSAAFNEARISFTRNLVTRLPLNTTTFQDLGGKTAAPDTPAPPEIGVTGVVGLNGAHPGLPAVRDHRWEFAESLTLLRGRHSFKFGGQMHRTARLTRNEVNTRSFFTFNGQISGTALGDFLLGRPSEFRQGSRSESDLLGGFLHLFAQDDYRVHPRLTLNLGVRWEGNPAYHDRFLRSIALRRGAQSTLAPSAPRSLLLAGDPGVPDGAYSGDWNNIAPRFGLAWDLTGKGKTSLRTGYGLFFETLLGEALRSAGGAPFSYSTVIPAPPGFADPFQGQANPFPFFFDPGNPQFPRPGMYRLVNPNMVSPYVMQYHLTLQHEFGGGYMAQAAYVGNGGRKLQRTLEINPALYRPGATLANVNTRRILQPGDFASLLEVESGSNSNYNALQLSLQKRFAKGYTIGAAYTWSKSLDDRSNQNVFGGSGQNPFNHEDDRGRSDHDRRHILSSSFVWEMPSFGQDIAARLLGGWSLSGFANVSSGNPLTVSSGRDNSLTGVNRDRPNLLGDPKLSSGRAKGETIARYFDTSKFAANGPGQYGNAGRNIIDGPGLIDIDLALLKNFKVTERHVFQLRMEAFNALNRVNLGDPGTNLAAPANFGRILGAGAPRIIQLALKYRF